MSGSGVSRPQKDPLRTRPVRTATFSKKERSTTKGVLILPTPRPCLRQERVASTECPDLGSLTLNVSLKSAPHLVTDHSVESLVRDDLSGRGKGTTGVGDVCVRVYGVSVRVRQFALGQSGWVVGVIRNYSRVIHGT